MATVEEQVPAKSGPSIVVQIGVLAVLTAMAVGGGWLSGGYHNQSRPQAPTTEAGKIVPHRDGKQKDKGHEARKGGEDEDAGDAQQTPDVVPIQAITTNLAAPSDTWVRLEMSLVFDGPTDAKIAQDVHEDLFAFMRTVKLAQVEGASGFQHLKEDLTERAAIRSKGRVKKILIKTLLYE
jgi:flagellar FliL protein